MSVTVKIYEYSGDHRCLEKVLPAPSAELTGVFRESVDILRPDFLVERSTVSGNYVHIGSPVNKFYYIADITQERTGLQVLHLREDVLMTYKSKIRQLPGVIERNPEWNNVDLPDPDFRRQQNTQAYTVKCGSAFSYGSTPRYILITVG